MGDRTPIPLRRVSGWRVRRAIRIGKPVPNRGNHLCVQSLSKNCRPAFGGVLPCVCKTADRSASCANAPRRRGVQPLVRRGSRRTPFRFCKQNAHSKAFIRACSSPRVVLSCWRIAEKCIVFRHLPVDCRGFAGAGSGVSAAPVFSASFSIGENLRSLLH